MFLDICHSDDYLKMLTKSEMKALLKEAIQRKKKEFLLGLQKSHSKTSNLNISDSIQEYLTTKRLATPMKQFLFRLRTRMTPNKVNFKADS